MNGILSCNLLETFPGFCSDTKYPYGITTVISLIVTEHNPRSVGNLAAIVTAFIFIFNDLVMFSACC